MAKLIFSDLLPVNGAQADTYEEQLWIYNALDNCITREVWDRLPKEPTFAYTMSRAMQGPALTMMRRGVRIDMAERDRLIIIFEARQQKFAAMFARLTREGLGREINPQSPQQLKQLFYRLLGCDEIKRYDKTKRERVVTCNREALEKLIHIPRATMFVKLLLAFRELTKLLQVLKTGIDSDSRMRCSYNVTGTETGRWSSSTNVFNTGTNLQNITDEMRRLFIADKGKKFIQYDLKQAESVVVAALSGDENYIAACKSGDPHTFVCELCWPELPWQAPHEATKKWKREVAERPYYRHFSFRDMAKKGGHGRNYGGTERVLAMHLKVPVKVANEFVEKYDAKFPGIRRWQRNVEQQLAATRQLTTPLGRRRYFTGRPTDSSVIKEAIAYVPQSTIGDLLNIGLYNVWEHMDLPGTVELLLQVHDSILFQFDPTVISEADAIEQARRLLEVPIVINGTTWIIGSDAVTGWNWGKVKRDKTTGEVINPHGLADWTGSDNREPPAEKSPLDRRLCELYVPFK